MELKPCPFCGGKAEAIQFSAPRTFGEGDQTARPKVWVVRCIKNGCGTLNTFYYDKKLAIDLWNTRASETPNRERIIELVEELSDLVGGGIDE